MKKDTIEELITNLNIVIKNEDQIFDLAELKTLLKAKKILEDTAEVLPLSSNEESKITESVMKAILLILEALKDVDPEIVGQLIEQLARGST